MNIFKRTFLAQAAAAYCCIGAAAFAAQGSGAGSVSGSVSGSGSEPASASAPVPDAMATQPDPREYVTRAETNLSALGNPFRFGGMNISWLALRSDTGRPEDARAPTDFEINDIFRTVQVLGAGYIRATSLAASAGCAPCLAPTSGQINPDALTNADHVLKLARDAGLKIVLPLAGDGRCAAGGALDPVAATPCMFAHARGLPDGLFYTDHAVRADFASHVVELLNHVNPETGLAWKDDPTILAWENCDACGAGVDSRALADWTEFLGQAIKAVDTRHLYENGAFAGRLAGLDASLLALPSVDIIGDRIAPEAGGPANPFAAAQQAVNKAGRVYLIDSYGWAPANWTRPDDFQAFLDAVVKDRAVAGAFVDDIGGHADQGGWLPPTRPAMPTLYFPGAPTRLVDLAAMAPRARAVRRFSYRMMDLLPISFATPDPPEIISAVHGKLVWRGSTGSATYSIARTSDLIATGSWDTICDQCVTDANPIWQDPAPPAGDAWYRMIPYNANAHAGLPSDPVQNK